MAGRVLVGGFEGFGRHRSNPASDIVLPAVKASDVDTVTLPVDFDRAYPALAEAYDKSQHEAVLLFGLGAHATNLLKIETRARNFDLSALFADAKGHRRVGPIEKGADWHRPVTIDTDLVKQAVEESGIRARLSKDAGAYVCNHVLYEALGGIEAPVGFIHIGRGVRPEGLEAAAHATVESVKQDK